MAKHRYTIGYLVYGCDSCKKGFKMYLHESLANEKLQPIKPVPFVIKCPFCGKIECRDVSFKMVKLPRQRIRPYMPAFINTPDDDCGTTINMERAVPEFRKRDLDPVVKPSSVAEALNDAFR